MAKVILDGWREGLLKISLAKLQRDKLGIPMNLAKHNVDFLLDDKEIILTVNDIEVAKEFIIEANNLGAKCKLINETD